MGQVRRILSKLRHRLLPPKRHTMVSVGILVDIDRDDMVREMELDSILIHELVLPGQIAIDTFYTSLDCNVIEEIERVLNQFDLPGKPEEYEMKIQTSEGSLLPLQYLELTESRVKDFRAAQRLIVERIKKQEEQRTDTESLGDRCEAGVGKTDRRRSQEDRQEEQSGTPTGGGGARKTDRISQEDKQEEEESRG